MSETSKTNLSEMMAGDGSGLSMPPAFVFVNTKKKRTAFKKTEDKIDGRKKAAKKLIQRVMSRRKTKMEENNIIISEGNSQSATEKAQKQIAQQKKLNRQKDLQKKRSEAKSKMMDKTKEMDTLLKARLADFKSKASEKQQKIQKQNASYEPVGDMIAESPVGVFNTASAGGVDVFATALKVAEEGSAYGRDPEISFANLVFQDGTSGRIGVFDAKRILATYEGLSPENRDKFRMMLNMSATSYQKALDFAVRNV